MTFSWWNLFHLHICNVKLVRFDDIVSGSQFYFSCELIVMCIEVETSQTWHWEKSILEVYKLKLEWTSECKCSPLLSISKWLSRQTWGNIRFIIGPKWKSVLRQNLKRLKLIEIKSRSSVHSNAVRDKILVFYREKKYGFCWEDGLYSSLSYTKLHSCRIIL